MTWLKELLRGTPEMALFVSLALGYAIGKVRVGGLSLGGIAGTLIVAIFVGMFSGVTLSDQVKNIAFALFIFTLGYMSGPSFFASLNRRSLRYGWFTLIEVVAVLTVTTLAILLLRLDVGTAAGLMAGGATESAVVGTATDAISRLPLPAAEIRALQANVGTAYSISYICGLITIVLLTSQIAPAVLRFSLMDEADKLWRRISGGQPGEDATTALPGVVGRAQRVTAAAGSTVAEVETALGGSATVERVRRGDRSIDLRPGTVLAGGDVLVLFGRREDLVRADDVVGPEVSGTGTLDLELDQADVLLTRKDFAAAPLGDLRREIPAEQRHGVYVTGITRMEQGLPVQPGTTINPGDVIRVTGAAKDVRAFAGRFGVRLDQSVKADFIFIALGVILGMLIGKITVPLGGIPLSLGTGGGCLLSGLLFGWIRARRPTIGQFDSAAATVIKNLGLATFICAVGLSSGPAAVALVGKYGISLPIAGVLVTLVPATVSLLVAFKVMKLAPPLALGAVAGQQCSTPAITAVQAQAGNSTPLMSYTIVYALSNVVLPLLGPIVVALAHAITG
ncbi:aspartate-alanine antiporter [Nonomuraea ceibae]|uniref:aspartate-alanine antiporter n=1 Tax=Nonomuraea ceibae TaxID=1935170 RepID=UPI001C5DD240|nr:aspartate-alanine antiporter [Nonomuraea ceibae]